MMNMQTITQLKTAALRGTRDSRAVMGKANQQQVGGSLAAFGKNHNH